MALSNNEKQAAFRKRNADLGRKRREFFLTDEEKLEVDKFIKRNRKAN